MGRNLLVLLEVVVGRVRRSGQLRLPLESFIQSSSLTLGFQYTAMTGAPSLSLCCGSTGMVTFRSDRKIPGSEQSEVPRAARRP